ncbi:MAG: hypothetical protein QXP68_01060 [Thermosphaera sp.]
MNTREENKREESQGKAQEESETRRERTDVEELREVLDAVSPFLERLKDWVKEIIGLVTSGLDGKKLGEDVGRFYQELKNQGLPEDLVIEMVRDYYKRRMDAIPSIEKLISGLTKFIGEEEEEESK